METEQGLKDALRSLHPDLFAADEPQALARMLREDVEARVRDANRRDARAWTEVTGACVECVFASGTNDNRWGSSSHI